MRIVALTKRPKQTRRFLSNLYSPTPRGAGISCLSSTASTTNSLAQIKTNHHDANAHDWSLSTLSNLSHMTKGPPENGRNNTLVKIPPTGARRMTPAVAIRWHSTAASDDSVSSMTPFLLADIGEGIAEVELLQWFVQEGDTVSQFDRICEVQSDKATVEITSRYDGQITSLEHGVGDMVKVGSPLLFLHTDEDESSGNHSDANSNNSASFMEDALQNDQEDHTVEHRLKIPSIASQYRLQTDDDLDGTSTGGGDDTTTPTDVRFKVQTTPAIRKLAKEYNLDLSTIVGTGPQGRVLKGDVLTVLRERGLLAATAATSSQLPHQATVFDSSKSTLGLADAPPATTVKDVQQVAGRPLPQDTTLEIRGYNRLMVQSMTASLQIPHMVFADEIDVSALKQHKLPFLPLAVKAMSQAMIQYPLLNSSFNNDDSTITLKRNHNIGIAMDTPRGLIVPVIHNCQEKSLAEILEDLKRLKALAQESEQGVPVEDLQGASITLSNIGAVGTGTYMSPIVTAPQVAIGAIGAIQRLPRFVGDSNVVEEVHVCNVSWGGDHRVIDGATMARFHKQWKDYMENPLNLIHDLK